MEERRYHSVRLDKSQCRGCTNCLMATLVLCVAMFGGGYAILYFALACGIAYALSGYFGLYGSQKIMYGKLKAEFINRSANAS